MSVRITTQGPLAYSEDDFSVIARVREDYPGQFTEVWITLYEYGLVHWSLSCPF